MKAVLALLAVAVVVALFYDAARVGIALARGRELTAASRAFERDGERVGDGAASLLVVGDSTGVGTGADSPADSVAGRIAREFPGLRVDNLARNGARYRDVAGQLRSAPRARYRVVLLQAGGNDILRFSSLGRLRVEVANSLELALERADKVIMMATGDVGTAPAMPWPLSVCLSARARQVRDLLQDAARSRADVHFVDLMEEGSDTPFLREPDRYYAVDGLHPSSAGYELWYVHVRRAVPLAEWL